MIRQKHNRPHHKLRRDSNCPEALTQLQPVLVDQLDRSVPVDQLALAGQFRPASLVALAGLAAQFHPALPVGQWVPVVRALLWAGAPCTQPACSP